MRRNEKILFGIGVASVLVNAIAQLAAGDPILALIPVLAMAVGYLYGRFGK